MQGFFISIKEALINIFTENCIQFNISVYKVIIVNLLHICHLDQDGNNYFHFNSISWTF